MVVVTVGRQPSGAAEAVAVSAHAFAPMTRAMIEPKRYFEYKRETKCSVDDCNQPAEYEVSLYDYYPPPMNEEFLEQDYTCPFLCEAHMHDNETLARGVRVPRGFVNYPYTNCNGAQGYTKYAPVMGLYDELYIESSGLIVPQTRIELFEVNEELIRYLAVHPEKLYEVDPRKFEEIVADIFRDRGFDVNLTPRTRDGGRDIQAIHHSSLGAFLYLIECKRYSSSRKVGVELVRALYGVKQREHAAAGVLVTTSSFTKDALDFANPLKYELSLRDFQSLQSWLRDYGRSS